MAIETPAAGAGSLNWLIGIALVALGIATVVVAGLRGRWLAITVAALLGGAAGYALDRPLPTTAVAPRHPISQIAERNAFLGQFNPSDHWLVIADAFAARGQTQDAVGLLRSATKAHPRDYALWLGLGNALVDHGRGLNPAARLAYARSAALAPTSAAPGYFLGAALLRSGDRDGALEQWRAILADAPANASWRPLVEDAVANAAAR